ncbi:MAG: glycosyltransferase family 2 protein [Acidimicrobiales bacterium]
MSRLRSFVERTKRRLRSLGLRQAAAIAGQLPPGRHQIAAATDLPEVVPSEDQLRRWALADELDYQVWCFFNGFVTLEEWNSQRSSSLEMDPLKQPFISVITPVFNTPIEYLRECIYSVSTQSYPFWELCIVDDASTDAATLAELEELADGEPRISIKRLAANVGICGATNAALEMASGDYVAFLDHDDRLSPDALFHVAELIVGDPNISAVYSDRDFINHENIRTNPLFKPHWAPETLLAGNYLFHLTVYRRTLIVELGGYRAEFEGSQDLDLALRVAETDAVIAHLARVLYHWRKHDGSMAGLPEAKPHIFDTGIAAIRAALVRRGIAGSVNELPDIWRGNYIVQLEPTSTSVERVTIADPAKTRSTVLEQISALESEHVLVTHTEMDVDEVGEAQMTAWLDQPHIAATTARIVDSKQFLRHAGLVRHRSGLPVAVYAGKPMTEPGHGVTTMSVRNISLIHPLLSAWRREVLSACLEASPFEGVFAMIDASIRAEALGYRLMYVPLATVTSDLTDVDPLSWPSDDATQFAEIHGDDVAYDWHFHWALDRENADGRIGVGAPLYRSDFG